MHYIEIYIEKSDKNANDGEFIKCPFVWPVWVTNWFILPHAAIPISYRPINAVWT